MANLVKIIDFVGEINIVFNTPICGEAQKMESIISQHETDIIVSLLGGMTSDFFAGLTNNVTKYEELLNGKEYVLNGLTLKFIGLQKLVAYRIYEIYQQNHFSRTTNNGETKNSNVGMHAISPNAKLANANNRFVKLVGTECNCNDQCSCEFANTLRNFLTVGDYDGWDICYTKNQYKNRLGL